VKITPGTGEIFVSKPFAGQDEGKQFTFDLAYNETSSQGTIYKESAAPIIDNVLEGYNGTIFAYG